MKYSILILIAGFFLFSCGNTTQTHEDTDPTQEVANPPAEGFNEEGSDAMAIAVADKVMEAMGGRKNWDNTRYLSWNFFGRRTHTWDRYEGRNRIVIPGQNLVIDMDINDMTGAVVKDSIPMQNPDSLAKYLDYGKKLWINDSYWLVMPYKLKDSGVTLKYLGMESSGADETCHKLQLTFSEVGVTPENKYEVLVDTASNLVCEWRYFPNFEMDTASIITPWADYKEYGNILLSGNRGKYELSEIRVLSDWEQ